jgi:hypothetical protein
VSRLWRTGAVKAAANITTTHVCLLAHNLAQIHMNLLAQCSVCAFNFQLIARPAPSCRPHDVRTCGLHSTHLLPHSAFEPDATRYLLMLALVPSSLGLLLSLGLNYVPFVEASEMAHPSSRWSARSRCVPQELRA